MTGDTPRSKPGYVEVRAFFTLAPQVGGTGRAKEGDRIAFFPDYVPYHRAYGMCVL